MSKDIIIYQPWGGLGDNLQFTTLPELYTNEGYNVYISDQNVYRNNEIFDLVWRLHPFIKGVSNLTPNAGSCKGFTVFDDNNCIKNMDLSHELSNGTAKYPKIYYEPKYISELEDSLLYDITSIASSYTDEFIKSRFESVFNKYPNLKRKLVKFKNINNRSSPDFGDDIIEVNSIFEYCDIINSCNVFVSLLSGSSALASAVKQDKQFPEIFTFHHSPYNKSFIFNFLNINLNCEPIE